MRQRRDVKIISASLTNDVNLKGVYTERMGKAGEQKHNFSATVAVHPDLRIAFNKLTPHVIALADINDSKGRVKPEKISVIGFTLAGSDTGETVTLTASRELENLKLCNITTPAQAWDDQVSPYIGTEELSLQIEECKAEVYAYLFEDKHQPDVQGNLFDQPSEDDSGRTSIHTPVVNNDEEL